MSPRELDPRTLGDHVDRLYRAAWALCGKREDAEDLVQETYARVLRRPRLLRNDDDLGYLLRVLRNIHVDHCRAAARSPRTSPIEAAPADALVDARETERRDRVLEAHEVYRFVAELPEDFRDVLVAVDVVGLSYEEAARALNIPLGTVMSRLYRGRGRVVRELTGTPA